MIAVIEPLGGKYIQLQQEIVTPSGDQVVPKHSSWKFASEMTETDSAAEQNCGGDMIVFLCLFFCTVTIQSSVSFY